MTYASDYVPSNSFADDETNEAAGRSTVRTVELDNQFADIAAAHNELNANVRKLQRDDDKLRDFIVEPRTLSEQLRAMLVVAGKIILGEWKPNTIYLIGVLVQRNNIAYICQTAHNSGPTFNLGFWIAVSGDGQAQAWAEQAEVSRVAAADAANTASASALTASVAASDAAASKIAAASSQLAAQNAADSIAGLSPVNLSAYMLGFLGGGSAAAALASLGAVATAELTSGFSNQIQAQRFGTIGGVSPYALASFHINKTAVAHAHYGVLDSTVYDFTANTQPLIGSASYNDNTTTAGVSPPTAGIVDHHYSFQSYPHITSNVGFDKLCSFFSQMDVAAGTVVNAWGANVANPLGAGNISNLIGLRIEPLNRGANSNIGVYIGPTSGGATNWQLYSAGTARSYFGGKVEFGNGTTSYASFGYDASLGHLLLQPRPGFGVKIGAGAGSRILRLGDAADDGFDATLENAGDGDMKLTARTGYSIKLQSPVKFPVYTVATLPAAAATPYARAFVSDASAGTFSGVVAGGGALRLPVYSDGTDWRIG